MVVGVAKLGQLGPRAYPLGCCARLLLQLSGWNLSLEALETTAAPAIAVIC